MGTIPQKQIPSRFDIFRNAALVCLVCFLTLSSFSAHAIPSASAGKSQITSAGKPFETQGRNESKERDVMQSAASPPMEDLAPLARSVVVMEAESGEVLYAREAHKEMPPASITKVMTMLLLMESIQSGQLKWSDHIRTSERAASMGGSQIFLQPGEQMTVRDMLKGIALASGNDASVAVAEHLAGSEAKFAERMNRRAKELGMNHTVFQNSNGLPAEGHYSSAYDIAIMSRALLQHGEIVKFTGVYQDHLRKDQPKPFWLVNTNKLVRFYPGADGLKTGYTSEAKYCLAATAKKDGMRIIVVVMGEPDPKSRNAEVSRLFDYAFSQYRTRTMVAKGSVLAERAVKEAEPEKVRLIAPADVRIVEARNPEMAGKDKNGGWSTEIVWKPSLTPPFDQKQPIAWLLLKRDGKEMRRIELKPEQSHEEAGWFVQLRRSIRNLTN